MTERRLVVDASIWVNAVVLGLPVPALEACEANAPTLVDYEFLQAARRLARSGVCTDEHATAAVTAFAELTITRHEAQFLTERTWSLRHTLTTYDASYVALAVALGAPLLTADKRLARTASQWCDVVGVVGQP